MSDCVNIKITQSGAIDVKLSADSNTIKVAVPLSDVKLTQSEQADVKAVLDAINIKVDRECIGVRETACPVIICIDGGLSSTSSYPAVNGLLNGGSS